MRPDTISPPAVWVPGVVERGLLHADRALDAALNLPRVSYAEQAHRADRLAEVYALRVRWWGVLLRWVFSPACDLPWIFGAAIVGAQEHDLSAARFWRETARDWRDLDAGCALDEHTGWAS